LQKHITFQFRFGKTKAGKQRFYCKSCEQSFTETKGTIFYRRRTAEGEIIECLVFVAEGTRISSIARAKGHKEDTILAWIRDAAAHAEAVEEILMTDYQLERAQIDALWSYVGHKGAKKNISKVKPKALSGALP
jgi:transposase-like protein